MKKTPGVDGKASLSFEERLELTEELRTNGGNWQHQKLREIPIPKKDGTFRTLKVPTVRDRIEQAIVKNALLSRMGGCIRAFSYGFRPGRSCQDAIEQGFNLFSRWHNWVLEADIKGF